MALPFLNGRSQKRDQVIAIDLGGRTTKAVHVQRQADGGLALLNYALIDAPVQKSFAVEVLADHLKAVVAALDTKTKYAALTLSTVDSLVRHAELPPIPVADMRQMLKVSPKSYLQQDLPNHLFDCYILPPKLATTRPDEKGRPAGTNQKLKVLVAGAKKQLVDDIQTATKNAGMVAGHISPGLVGPLNAFEMALPDVFNKEVVALVDIGFKSTTVSLLQEGELVLTRVLTVGGDKFTTGLAEALSITYAEAEGIKVGMPTEVQPALESLISPLGRELRASIDFFEHQQERHVSQIYISGGSAQSAFIVKILESELMIPCRVWNPLGPIKLSLPLKQTAEFEQVSSQLTVALGTAAAAL